MGSIAPLPHIAIFPFMAKGHTLPLIHLAHLIHRRGVAALTFFTTPLNAPFLRQALADTDSSVIELPFPKNLPGLPPEVESTDHLPSMAYYIPFVDAVGRLRPHFEQALRAMPDVSFLISDGFLTWTVESAAELGIRRIVFYGMGNFSWTILNILAKHRPFTGLDTPDQCVIVPGLQHVRLTEHDLSSPLGGTELEGPFYEFIQKSMESLQASYGMIVNSFYELDGLYFDHWNSNVGPKAWCIGPLCLAGEKCSERTPSIEWLDSRLAAGRPVVYVAFGTQAEISEAQLREIAAGLEFSGLDFLWVVRAEEAELGEGFKWRVAERGMVVRDWVDQNAILRHPSIKGFVSHCGWNSVLESLCAGVPILAWPMMAEQHLNAKFVVDELRIGLRIRASDGTRNGLVKGEDLARMVNELVAGEGAKEAEENVKGLAEAARKAVGRGGSSWRMLEQMIDEASRKK